MQYNYFIKKMQEKQYFYITLISLDIVMIHLYFWRILSIYVRLQPTTEC